MSPFYLLYFKKNYSPFFVNIHIRKMRLMEILTSLFDPRMKKEISFLKYFKDKLHSNKAITNKSLFLFTVIFLVSSQFSNLIPQNNGVLYGLLLFPFQKDSLLINNVRLYKKNIPIKPNTIHKEYFIFKNLTPGTYRLETIINGSISKNNISIQKDTLSVILFSKEKIYWQTSEDSTKYFCQKYFEPINKRDFTEPGALSIRKVIGDDYNKVDNYTIRFYSTISKETIWKVVNGDTVYFLDKIMRYNKNYIFHVNIDSKYEVLPNIIPGIYDISIHSEKLISHPIDNIKIISNKVHTIDNEIHLFFLVFHP